METVFNKHMQKYKRWNAENLASETNSIFASKTEKTSLLEKTEKLLC